MKWIICVLLFLGVGNLFGEPLSPIDAIEKDIAGEYRARPYPSADEVLNAEIDKRLPASPLYPTNVEPVREGFAAQRLSAVPKPGVHPRVILSPSDIETMRRYVLIGNAAPPAFRMAFSGLKVRAAKDGHRHSEQAPWVGPTTGLGCKALLALITEDEALGRECVPIILEHADAVRADLDKWMDEEFAGAEEWVKKEIAHDHMYAAPRSHCFSLAMEYDYAYGFMTDGERQKVRDVIASYTAGKYTSFMEMPDHFLINNHWGFAMNWWVGSLAIEGEKGWDRRVGDVGRRKVTAYVTSSLSPDGLMFEGQKPNLPPYAILAAARRGPRTLAMHPHLHAYAEMAANSIHWVGGDDAHWRLGRVGYQGLGGEVRIFPDTMMKFFYPDDELIDLVWRLKSPVAAYGPKSSSNHATSGHGGLDVGLVYSLGAINEDDHVADPNRDELPQDILSKVPLTWHDPLRGALRTRSGWGRDDIMLWFENKSDYFSAGHEVSEHNNFLFSSHGVAWTPYAGRYQAPKNQNMILIDGLASPRWQPVPGRIVGVYDSDAATAVCGEATDGYNWDKGEKLQEAWHSALGVKGWDWMTFAGMGTTRDYELPFHPVIRKFNEGFAHLEWGNWHGETRGPERYEQWNQVQKVIRTVQLSRGKHPYILVIDDVKKDDAVHTFDWVMNMNRKTVLVKAEKDDLILGMEGTDAQLLVRVLYRKVQEQTLPPAFTQGRVMITAASIEPEFRVLLFPHNKGDALPQTEWSTDRRRLHVRFTDQVDLYHFDIASPGRAVFTMERDGDTAQTVTGEPAAPELADAEDWYGSDCVGIGGHRNSTPDELRHDVFPFAGATTLRLRDPLPGSVIRFTTDGTEPGTDSRVYAGPVPIGQTMTIKARTFAPRWPYGDGVSVVRTLRFERRDPVQARRQDVPRPGQLSCDLFEVCRTLYEPDGFFSGKKNMMPEFLREAGGAADRGPRLRTMTAGLEVPRLPPLYAPRRQTKGFYRYRGCFHAAESGVHRFRLRAPGPLRLTVGGENAIEHTGQYYLGQRDHYGAAVLASGWHEFELVFCDPCFYRGRYLSVSKDYGHGGKVPISITYERDLGPSLALLGPSATRYEPVAAERFGSAGEEGPAYTPAIAINDEAFAAVAEDAKPGLVLRKYDRSEVVASTSDGFLLYDAELLLTDGSDAFSDDIALALADNNVRDGMELHEYSGLFHAPVAGVHQFRTDRSGVNELRVHDQVVQNSRLTGPWPAGGVKLEAGWHPITLRLFRSDAVLELKRPGAVGYQAVSMRELGRRVAPR